MRRLARSLLRDASLADDVVQETALAAWRRARASEAPPRSWWAAVVRNVAAKMGRGSRRREERERAAARPEAQPGATSSRCGSRSIAPWSPRSERISPEQRDVVVRRWFDGQKPQRIAEELGVPLATVKTRLRRALSQLRERLKREWGDGVAGMLATLARPYATSIAVSSITAGALLMGTKLKVVAALVVAAIACAWIAGALRIGRESTNPGDVAQASQPAAIAAGTSTSPIDPPAVVRVDERPAPETTPPGPEDPRRFAGITGVVLGPRGPMAVRASNSCDDSVTTTCFTRHYVTPCRNDGARPSAPRTDRSSSPTFGEGSRSRSKWPRSSNSPPRRRRRSRRATT